MSSDTGRKIPFCSASAARCLLLLALAALAQGSVAFLYALARYVSFKASGYDIGDFVQALHNVTHGNGLAVTLAPPHVMQHWLAVHFSPVLYLLTPLYALLPQAEALLALHSFAIALGALPLYGALRAAGVEARVGVAVALLYLINPFVLNAGIWDFHEIAFAPFLMASALWALLAKRRGWFSAACVALIMVKEHYGIAVAGFGVLWALHNKERRFGFAVAASGVVACALIPGVAMPLLGPTGGHIMLGAEGQGLQRFAWTWDALPAQALQGAAYVGVLLLAWIFLPLRAAVWLLPAAADVLVNLLSTNAMMRSPFAYHSAAVIPVLAVAAAHGLRERPKHLYAMCAVAGVMAYALSALPLPGAFNPWKLGAPMLRLDFSDEAALRDMAQLIPANVPMAAQNNAAAHLAARAEIYQFAEADLAKVQWLVLRLPHPYADGSDPFHSVYGVPREQYRERIDAVFGDAGWGVAYYKHGWLVMKRGAADAIWRGRIMQDMKK